MTEKIGMRNKREGRDYLLTDRKKNELDRAKSSKKRRKYSLTKRRGTFFELLQEKRC